MARTCCCAALQLLALSAAVSHGPTAPEVPGWAVQFGAATVNTEPADSAVHAADGSVYVAGIVRHSGGSVGFVRKFASTGRPEWQREVPDEAVGVALDPHGHAFVTGHTNTSSISELAFGGWDSFLAKYDPNGQRLWITQFGTNVNDHATAVAVDSSGTHIVVVGYTDAALPGATHLGMSDGFLAKIHNDGSSVMLYRQFGTASSDYAVGLALDASDFVYIGGMTQGALPHETNRGDFDRFIVTYSNRGNILWQTQEGTAYPDYTSAIAVDVAGSTVYLAGYVVKHATTCGVLVALRNKGATRTDTTILCDSTKYTSLAAMDVGGLVLGGTYLLGAFVELRDSNMMTKRLIPINTDGESSLEGGVLLDAADSMYLVGSTTGELQNQTRVSAAGFVRKYDHFLQSLATPPHARVDCGEHEARSCELCGWGFPDAAACGGGCTWNSAAGVCRERSAPQVAAQSCDETISGALEVGYRGCQSETISGRRCQEWTSQSPHMHDRTPADFPSKGLGSHNHCRNPDGQPGGIWCFTIDPTVRWEYCEPACFNAGIQYHPLNMDGQQGTVESSPEACQARCGQVSGCAHFAFRPSGQCHLQDSGASAGLDNDPAVISGPDTCEASPSSLSASLADYLSATSASARQLAAQPGAGAVLQDTPSGLVLALRLDTGARASSQLVSAEGATAAALVPAAALRGGEAAADGVVAVVTALDVAAWGRGARAAGAAGVLGGAWSPPVDVTLYSARTGRPLRRPGEVGEPFLVRISQATEPPDVGPAWCAYLEGGAWQVDSMRRATAEEVASGLVGNPGANLSGVWCASDHLTIFAAFHDPLECTHVNVFAPEAWEATFSDLAWLTRAPALLLWILLGCLAVVLAAACTNDAWIWHKRLWRDRYFITSLPPQHVSCCACGCCACGLFGTKPPEGVLDWLARRAVVHLVRCHLAVYSSVSVRTLRAHYYGSRGFLQSSLAAHASQGFAQRLGHVQDLPAQAMQSSFGAHGFLYRTSIFWRALHPLTSLCHWSIEVSFAKRAKLLIDSLLASLMFAAIIFSVLGEALSANSPESCPLMQKSFLWYVLVGLLSTIFSALPQMLTSVLVSRGFVDDDNSNPRRRHLLLCRFRTQGVIFWLFGCAWSALHVLLISSFLATLEPREEWKWLLVFASSLSVSLLIRPVLLALLLSAWVGLIIGCRPGLLRAPPRELGIDTQKELDHLEDCLAALDPVAKATVQELAGRGISVGHLLDFFQRLGKVVMPHFDPEKATTHDVVRQAIIPMSRSDAFTTFGTPLLVTIGGLRLRPLEGGDAGHVRAGRHRRRKPWGSAEGLFCKCQVPGKPLSAFKTWPLSTAAEEDWNLEAEVLGYRPGQELEFTVLRRSAPEDLVVARGHLDASQMQAGSFEGEVRLYSRSGFSLEACLLVRTRLQMPLSPTAEPGDADSHAEEDSTSSREEGEANDSGSSNAFGEVWKSFWRAGLCQPEQEPNLKPSRHELRLFGRSSLNPTGYAYATLAVGGRYRMPSKMVVHSWGGLFSHLLAAIVADALGHRTYDVAARLLAAGEVSELRARLGARGKLGETYWVCAFSVNQHASICKTPPPADSTGARLQPCDCCSEKALEGAPCETNKFDELVAFLRAAAGETSAPRRFAQLVVLDIGFELFSRIRCIAELLEAHKSFLPQAVKVHSMRAAEDGMRQVGSIDVREARASFERDRKLILSKIEDIDVFNSKVRVLVAQHLSSILDIPNLLGELAQDILTNVVV